MLVGADVKEGLTGTAIDFLSPTWQAFYCVMRRRHYGRLMWCAFDALPPRGPPPESIRDYRLEDPPAGAHIVPQCYLMRIEPDEDVRAERTAPRKQGAPA